MNTLRGLLVFVGALASYGCLAQTAVRNQEEFKSITKYSFKVLVDYAEGTEQRGCVVAPQNWLIISACITKQTDMSPSNNELFLLRLKINAQRQKDYFTPDNLVLTFEKGIVIHLYSINSAINNSATFLLTKEQLRIFENPLTWIKVQDQKTCVGFSSGANFFLKPNALIEQAKLLVNN